MASAAAQAADCVLATHQHLRLPGFPIASFQYLLEFVEEVRVLRAFKLTLGSCSWKIDPTPLWILPLLHRSPIDVFARRTIYTLDFFSLLDKASAKALG